MTDAHFGTCSWTPEGDYSATTPFGEIQMFGESGHRAVELMLLSSAACLNFFLVEYAKARELPVRRMEVTCSGSVVQHPERVARIETFVTIDSDLSDKDLRKMVSICERACKIMNTLKQSPETLVHINHEKPPTCASA